MNDNITFVKTRYWYDSYTDFWKLVELAGFPSIYVDELRLDIEGVYIVCPMNGEWRPHITNEHLRLKNEGQSVAAHLVFWNLERPAGSKGSLAEYTKQCRYLINGLWENGELTSESGQQSHGKFIDEIWVSDAKLADETQHATRFVVLGSHAGLGTPGTQKKYDFCHMSYEVPRRQTIYTQFPRSMIGPNSWGDERHQVLQQSRFALNVHQDQFYFQEPLRFALFAAYGLPIISETCFNPRPWIHNDTIYLTGYDDLVNKLHQIIPTNYYNWAEMGRRAREMMTGEYEFGKMVRQAINQSVNNWR